MRRARGVAKRCSCVVSTSTVVHQLNDWVHGCEMRCTGVAAALGKECRLPCTCSNPWPCRRGPAPKLEAQVQALHTTPTGRLSLRRRPSK